MTQSNIISKIFPEIDLTFTSSSACQKVSRYISQVAAMIGSSVVSKPSSEIRADSCCPMCKKADLPSVVNFFCTSGMRNTIISRSLAFFRTSTQSTTQSTQNSFYSFLQHETEQHVLASLRRLTELARFRTSELIQALALFDAVTKTHWTCSTLSLFELSIGTIFFVCCILAHKMNGDRVISNKVFAEQIFGISPATVIEYERTILALLDYSAFVKPETYQLYYQSLFGSEPANSATSKCISPPATIAVQEKVNSVASVPVSLPPYEELLPANHLDIQSLDCDSNTENIASCLSPLSCDSIIV